MPSIRISLVVSNITNRERSVNNVSSISTRLALAFSKALAVEERYRKQPLQNKKDRAREGTHSQNDDESSNSSTDSEEEDDEGILASEELDAQIQATLQAIRAKDPRVYDEKAIFYTDENDGLQVTSRPLEQKTKPMYLSDYHRRNLLEGGADMHAEDEKPISYEQQQDNLREAIVREMHATVNNDDNSSIQSKCNRRINAEESDESDDADQFLMRKIPQDDIKAPIANVETVADLPSLGSAEKDPETFLSNFLSARAWVPSAGSKFQPFESDDEDDDQRAEAFEEAFNLRFEDPKGSNEKLLSHARDAAAKRSVRKETLNSRQKIREDERANKEAEKREREKDKARLRKLRLAEAEEKIKKIKDTAGLKGSQLEDQDWIAFLDEGWDDSRWEEEMRRRFGDDYYADNDVQDDKSRISVQKQKTKKPKWQDDIDIKDLVPDFEEKDSGIQHWLNPTDEGTELNTRSSSPEADLAEDSNRKAGLNGKQIRKQREDSKNEARRQRRKIEEHIDKGLKVEETLSGFGTKHAGHFRYRETSPLTYGLTARDILMATDGQLNQYAGLKKMATFRDTEKKRRDKKRLGKKARLRQWRKETFGDENGPQIALENSFTVQNSAGSASVNDESQRNIDMKPKPRSRRRKPIASS